MLPGTSLAGANVARSQLLRPYPQFTSVLADTNQAYSWYHSLQVRYDKRFSSDLSTSVSYTWSKLMEARTFLNETDATPEEVISDQDRTHRLAVTWIYQLLSAAGGCSARAGAGLSTRHSAAGRCRESIRGRAVRRSGSGTPFLSGI